MDPGRCCLPRSESKWTLADFSEQALSSLVTARFTVRIGAPEPNSDLSAPLWDASAEVNAHRMLKEGSRAG
jgi:hypothetical protein